MRPDEIARLRLRLHLTQRTLGGLLGVSAAAVASWEGGRRRARGPAVVMMRRMEAATTELERLVPGFCGGDCRLRGRRP